MSFQLGPRPAIAEKGLVNRLAGSSSPYIRSHQDNPVAWQEWTPSALSLAKKHNQLIFLSIGYHACHWCHVMERESFSSPEVAAVLNTSFIPIKVDREVRPDIDEIYMNYVTATTGAGGWPLNVFLTPNLEPVFGGTYWPAPGSHSLPRLASMSEEAPLSFLDVLEKMRDVWSTQQQRCIQSAQEITQQLKDFAAEGTHSHSATRAAENDETEPLDIDLLDDALDYFTARYDPIHGGFSSSAPSAPKFPTPPNLAFLLRIGAAIERTSTRFGFPSPIPPILGEEACARAASMSLHTLLSISRSGLRDHLGHGFHRYSVTPDWNLPHFEKMLYDNAQLLSCYCDAFALSRDPEILGTIYSLIEYFSGPNSTILDPLGGFYASEDADSFPSKGSVEAEKREGAFYVWTLKEIQSILAPRETDASILACHFGVQADGNVPLDHDAHDEFLGQNVLHITATPSVLAKEFGMPEAEIVRIIKNGRMKLQENREKFRKRPEVDTKIIAGWNGLAISALARAANTLAGIDEERSTRCRLAAEKAAVFLKEKMYHLSSGKLDRIYHARVEDGGSSTEQENAAFLDDYAYVTQACLQLHDLTFDDSYLEWAENLQNYTTQHFLARTTGGFFQSSSTSSTSILPHIIRLKPGTDTALPSPNSLVAQNLLYLSSFLGDASLATLARKTINAFAIEIIQHPFLFVTMLGAIVMEGLGVKTVVVIGLEVKDARALEGWGRTVVRLDSSSDKTKWLGSRNEMLQNLMTEENNLAAGGDGSSRLRRGRVLICQAGRCRELREGELDEDVSASGGGGGGSVDGVLG